MTVPGGDVAELLDRLAHLTPDELAALIDELPEDERQALEACLGPDGNEIEAARTDTADPLTWLRATLPELMPIDPGPHHRRLAEALDPHGPTGVRQVIGAPRGSGKSTLTLNGIPILVSVRRSHRFTVVIRDNLPDAVSAVRGIRTLLESRPELTARYPWITPMPGEAGELHLAGGAVILARSTGSAIRGLVRVLADGTLARPDLVLGDDLEDDESARSELQVGRLQDWILGTVGQLGGPPGDQQAEATLDVLVIGTTIERSCLVARMLGGTGPFQAWRRHRFPAEAAVEERDGQLVAVDTDGQPVGIDVSRETSAGGRVALWPQGLPLTYLDRLSDPDDELYVGSILYAREYLLRPVSRSNILFAAANTVWRPGLAEQWLDGHLVLDRKNAGVDPAVSVKETADYFAIVVSAMLTVDEPDEDGDPHPDVIAIPYAERRRCTPAEALEWVATVCGIWLPDGRVAFEAEGGFAWAADELRRKKRVAVRPVASMGKDKRARAVPLSVWHERRRVWVDAGLRGSEWDREFHAFTGTGDEEHDDLADATVWSASYATNAFRRR